MLKRLTLAIPILVGSLCAQSAPQKEAPSLSAAMIRRLHNLNLSVYEHALSAKDHQIEALTAQVHALQEQIQALQEIQKSNEAGAEFEKNYEGAMKEDGIKDADAFLLNKRTLEIAVKPEPKK